ncbi:ATP-binding protein [Kovacikia minuta CCNUW1]|uniref:P-loop NTPase fold protein n=1 Tax=Kovacikia minuta TaxID=2931930 RepID=UPI001CCC961D|nr:P-loop NTPase fold protein [Kovacikia minuta]UBF24488.1 ATP-binding protein [Kovacikia minuta CCNUW1]
MGIDLRQFFQATNPSKTLVATNEEDQKYYIDFSSVRGSKIIEELKDNITFFSPDAPTCVLFTGHIGCGKSTELLRLKAELEQEGFHVVYFESSEDLEMADVDISDVLLAIAKRVSESLEKAQLNTQAKGFRALLENTMKVLLTEVDVKAKAKLPGLEAGLSSQGEFSLSAGIAELTVIAKNDQGLRERLNQYLGPQKNKLLEAINKELLEPAIVQLKQRGRKGLVVIVDNLDRIDNRTKSFGRPQQEYLFIDQSECLTRLNCHLVYTMPLALKFSNEYGMLTQRYEEPKVLPMVPIQFRDGNPCEEGLKLLRQMVLSRAFPDLDTTQQIEQVTEIFDTPATLDRLCCVSGGHVRDLLRLLNDWIKKGRQLPLSSTTLEEVIRARRNEMMMPISDEEWELLRQVRQRKKVSGDQGYQTLIRSRLVFEYRDRGESWFDVNPILTGARELDGS